MEVLKLKKKKEKLQNEGNLNGLQSVSKELADVYFQQENYDEALCEYNELLQIAEAQGSKIDIARANRMIGEVLCAKADFNEALRYELIHLGLSREENDLIEEQRALATLGRTYFLWAEVSSGAVKQNNLDEATKYYLKSLSVCDRLKDEAVGHKQKLEMRARLFLNLGLVWDSLGKYESSVDNLSKAIAIFRSQDLWEDLYRGHYSLAMVHQRHSKSKDSLSHCDQAALVAERLPDKVSYLAELLPTKAEILLELPDFRGARQALLKAYKLKPPNKKVKMEIERKLRTVAAMCECEEKLLSLPAEGELETRKKLYESIADMASSIGVYQLALNYYLLMLDCVEKSGGDTKTLIESYVSLAQTYLDIGNASMAFSYFKKELALEKDNPNEAAKTCLNMADALEKMEKFDEMIKYYQQAKVFANKAGNAKLRKISMKSLKISLTLCGRKSVADDLIGSQEFSSDDSENEGTPDQEESTSSAFGAHISIDDLTDDERISDNEETDRPRTTRGRQKPANILKRNEKGETPLHVAAINGNLALVEKLLQQGHSVDVKDFSGWTPLHEACNHGHIAVVEALLAAGASVNDRGGPLCDGVTPLLDAASNGNFAVMDLLLERGASPVVRTNNGESTVDCMEEWRKRYIRDVGHDLDPSSRAHYEMLHSKLKVALERTGHKMDEKKKSPLSVPSSRSQRRNQDSINKSNLRKGLEDKRLMECKVTEATTEYETTMKALRHRNKSHEVSSLAKIPISSGLVAPEECITTGDDWLEEDIIRPQKKRRMSSLSSKTSRSVNPLRESESPSRMLSDTSDDSNDSFEESFSTRLKSQNSTRRRQMSLTAAGVTQEKVRRASGKETSAIDSSSNSSSSQSEVLPPVAPVMTQSIPSQMNCIKVRIEDKLFLIAVPLGDIMPNISWLAQVASSRYLDVEGVEPEIRLATEDGALLSDNDPVCVVFGCKEVLGIVKSWKVESLESRYRTACQASNTKMNKKLLKLLEQSQATGELSLKEMFLQATQLETLLKALYHHNSLRILNLSGNQISEQTFKLVTECLMKLPQLEALDLSCTNLTVPSLNFLNQALEKTKALQRLQHLYLGFNRIGESLESLCKLLMTIPALSTLSIPSIGLTPKQFRSPPDLTLECIEWISVNDNNLGQEGATELLGRLDCNRLRGLCLSRTGTATISMVAAFITMQHPPALSLLDLSYCTSSEADMDRLVDCLSSCVSLDEVRLDGCSLTDNQIAKLVKLPIALSISGSQPRYLDLPGQLRSLNFTSSTNHPQAVASPYNFLSLRF